MSFEDQVCTECDSSSVFRLPSLGQTKLSFKSSGKPGKIVDQYIQDVKKELKQEKINLRSEEI